MAEIESIDKPVSEGPIKLSYVYKGNCGVCGTPVDTLEQDIKIDGKNHYFVSAYCMRCKKQQEVKEVKKLEEE